MIGRARDPYEIFRVFGSVLPRTLHWGVLAAIEGFFLDWSTHELFVEGGLWHNTFAVQVLGTVIGFALVMRVQIAYQRFWEGATHLRAMSAKLGDAAMQICSFDEINRHHLTDEICDEHALEFRLTSMHYCSLFHATVLVCLRGDDEVTEKLTMNIGDPYMFLIHSAEETDEAGNDSAKVSSEAADPLGEVNDAGKESVGSFTTHATDSFTTHATDESGAALGDSGHGGSSLAYLEILPQVDSDDMPPGWEPKKPVPLQQVIRARRALMALDVKAGRPPRQYNSIVPAEFEGVSVQPRSVWNTKFTHSDVYRAELEVLAAARRASSSHERHTESGRHLTRHKTVALGKPPKASFSQTKARSSTGAGGLARNSEALGKIQYLLSIVFLRQSAEAAAELAQANGFDIVGGLSRAEVGLLKAVAPCDRPYVVMNWILRAMAARIRHGGLAVDPPLLSRTYQILSDGMLGAEQAMKLSETPFPFPLRQLLALLLLAFQVLVPLCVAAFVDSPPLVAFLSFMVCLGYMSLNSVAMELEHPFGLGANHLPVVSYQDRFNTKLSRLLDLTSPELGYLPTTQLAA